MTDPIAPKEPEFESNRPQARVDTARGAINSGMSEVSPREAPWERETLEKLAMAAILEQRQSRRWRNAIRIAWLVFLVGLVWLGMDRGTASTDATMPHTAIVKIEGEISASSEASAALVGAAMRSAFEDKGSMAVVLLINSPGGSPVQAGIINDEIRRLKALHNKPVYVVVEETCASAAYYIAAAADKIYVDKASVVGSIGVLMDGFGFTGLMDKLGIERRLLTAGDNKGMLDPFTAQNPKQRAFAQAMIHQIHQQFIQAVRDGRGDRLKETSETFSGLFWNGEEAIKLGLVDKFGSLDFVAREVIKAEDVIDYTPRENVAERLAKRFGAAMGEGAMRSASSLLRLR